MVYTGNFIVDTDYHILFLAVSLSHSKLSRIPFVVCSAMLDPFLSDGTTHASVSVLNIPSMSAMNPLNKPDKGHGQCGQADDV
jgi:hypothetical protein